MSGQPVALYYWPPSDIKNYGIKPDPDLHRELEEQVADWGESFDLYSGCGFINWL